MHIFSAVIGLATTLILAGLIGAGNYGVYAVAMVYANVFAYIACLGFTELIVRTEARDNHDTQRTSNTQRTATILAVATGLILAGFGIAIGTWVVPTAGAHAHWAFVIAMGMVVPIAYQRLRESTLLGRHRPLLSLLPERLVRSTSMLFLVIGLALFANTSLGADHAVAAQGLAYLVSILAAVYLVSKTNPSSSRAIRSQFDATLIKDALPFFLVGLTTLFASRLDIMMLAFLTDAQTVGQYRLAAQVAAVVMMISTVSQAILSPKVSKLSNENRLHELVARLPRLGRALFLAAASLSVAIYFAFQLALPWIGADFANATNALIILLATFSVIAFLCPAVPILLMGGHAKIAAYVNFIAIALNIILNLLLIPPLGGAGAAIATLISLTTLYGLYAYFAWRTSI